MPHLDAAYSYVQSSFTSSWGDQFISSLTSDNAADASLVAQLQVDITGKLEQIATELFRQLNISLLSGEYVTDILGFKQKIDSIETYVQGAGANLDFPAYPNMTIIAQDEFQSYFYTSTKQVLHLYKSLLDFVNSHLIYQPNTSTLFYVVNNDDQSQKEGSEAAKQSTELFQLNVQLAKIDHSISFTKAYFTRLILIQDKLRKLTTSSTLAEVLYKKCGFLLYKISVRLKQSQKNYLYAIDFSFSTVSLTEIPEFALFNQIIIGHYNTNFNTPLYDSRQNDAVSKLEQSAPLDLNDYHSLIKYYKDDLSDLSKLKSLQPLYAQFYSINRPAASKFDQKAFDVTFCYLLNNILSLELDKKEFNLANWKVKFKYYTDEADKYKNKNFFPYYKIINKFLLEEIVALFQSKECDLTVLKNLIADYKANLTNLVENLGICQETDYLAFQNDYNNCVLNIKDSSGNMTECFIGSSFVLPINYKELREELENFKAELNKFNSMFEFQKMINADRNALTAVKNEMQNTDKRNIEILSIFAALVMFVSNEVQIFSKIPNMADAVAYSLFFAFGLGLFVLMIWFITRPDGLKKGDLKYSHKIIIGFYLVGFIAAILYVSIVKFANSNQNKLNELQFQIDSTKKARSIDTLKKREILPKSIPNK